MFSPSQETQGEDHAWWSVTLYQPYAVSEVMVVNSRLVDDFVVTILVDGDACVTAATLAEEETV